MQVTWWELEELLDHFNEHPGVCLEDGSRTKMYEQLAPNMWLVQGSREGPPVPWYGIAIVPPRAHKYGCATLRTSLIDQSRPNIDLEWLVLKFTSYNIRLRITEAMVEELKCDQQTATLMGIGLSYIALVSPDPSSEEFSFSDADRVDNLQANERLLLAQGGGWTKLRRVGRGVVNCRVSCKAYDDTGFSSHLVGFLRPVDGRAETLDGVFPTHETEDPGEDVDTGRDQRLPFQQTGDLTDGPSNLPSEPCMPAMSDAVPEPTAISRNRDGGAEDQVQGDEVR
jgi:hypothetical protein